MRGKIKTAVIIIVIVIVLYAVSWRLDFSSEKPRWGATFSQLYAEELGLNWQAAYTAILDELPLEQIRLAAHWDRLEPAKGTWRFGDLDWQIEQAQERNKSIVLVIGFRVPRWPECHIPQWAKNLPKQEFENGLFNYLETVVKRYKDNSAVKIWQVENEPLLSVFGECPKPDRSLLKREIALVKSLDPAKPVMITASGELSLVLGEVGLSEILGTTLYRVVWNPTIGYFRHIYPPVFYTAKAGFARAFPVTSEVVISELQAEPWTQEQKPIAQIDFQKQTAGFPVSQLKSNLGFAKKTGIRDIYLWGVEWWYYRKVHGDPSYLETGKEILSGPTVN